MEEVESDSQQAGRLIVEARKPNKARALSAQGACLVWLKGRQKFTWVIKKIPKLKVQVGQVYLTVFDETDALVHEKNTQECRSASANCGEGNEKISATLQPTCNKHIRKKQ